MRETRRDGSTWESGARADEGGGVGRCESLRINDKRIMDNESCDFGESICLLDE